MTRSSTAEGAALAPSALTRALQVASTLSVLSIVVQGVTAGEILARSRSALVLHATGAIVLHVLTGLTVVAAFLVLRRDGGARWPTAIAAVVFVVGFVQAALGDAGVLAVHVPLALLLLVGAVVVAVSSFSRRRTPQG